MQIFLHFFEIEAIKHSAGTLAFYCLFIRCIFVVFKS